jgi:hypothetical protein
MTVRNYMSVWKTDWIHILGKNPHFWSQNQGTMRFYVQKEWNLWT